MMRGIVIPKIKPKLAVELEEAPLMVNEVLITVKSDKLLIFDSKLLVKVV
jgi:hypothetical protein